MVTGCQWQPGHPQVPGRQCPFSWTQVKMQLQSQGASRVWGTRMRLIPGLSLGLAVFPKAFSKVALVCHVRAQPGRSDGFLLDEIILGTRCLPAGMWTCTAWWSISDHKPSSVQEVLLTTKWETMLEWLSVLGKAWRKCVCGRINVSVHYSAAFFSMITTKQKLSLTSSPCYCRLSLDRFLQIPNLIGVGQWEKLKQKSESLFLSTGEPDNNSVSLGWGDRAHMDITPAEYPSTVELPWTLRKTGYVLHAWQSREIELCLWHQLIFSPSSNSGMLQQGTMLLRSPHRLYFPLPSSPICLRSRDFSEGRSPLLNVSFYSAWNLRRGLTAAFHAQSLNKENKSLSENLLFCWEVHAC